MNKAITTLHTTGHDEGIEQTSERWPGIASTLSDSLCELACRKKQWDVVTAHAAYAFFNHPDRHPFDDLTDKAKQARCSRKVQTMALDFLQTGESPILITCDRKNHLKVSIDANWPLPVPSYLQTPGRIRTAEPHWDMLLDIAIAVKRPKDVRHWFDRMFAEVQFPQV